jgi:hypothetical protein
MIATRSCAELEHVRQELLYECLLTLTTATALDHLMILSPVIMLHRRQLRTPRSHAGAVGVKLRERLADDRPGPDVPVKDPARQRQTESTPSAPSRL